MIVFLVFSFPLYYRFINAHLAFNFSFNTVKKSVYETNDSSFLIEVRIFIYVLEALKKRNDDKLNVFELVWRLYLADRFLNYLHIFIVPFGFLGPLYHTAFLFHESFNWAYYAGIRFFGAVTQDLDGDLNIGLFNFSIDSFQYAREISPIVDFPDHAFPGDGISQSV